MVDIASIIMLMSFFGTEIALLYVLVGLILAVVGGAIIDKLSMEDEIQDYIKEMESAASFTEELNFHDRLRFGVEQVKQVAGKVWPYVLIGVGVGAIIHNWIPESFIQNILGNDNPFAVVLAAVIGAPIYADIFGVLPIAEALYAKGIPIGTLIAFMISVTTLSLPSLIMLSQAVKPKLLATFIAICLLGILLIGYLFNFLAT